MVKALFSKSAGQQRPDAAASVHARSPTCLLGETGGPVALPQIPGCWAVEPARKLR